MVIELYVLGNAGSLSTVSWKGGDIFLGIFGDALFLPYAWEGGDVFSVSRLRSMTRNATEDAGGCEAM